MTGNQHSQLSKAIPIALMSGLVLLLGALALFGAAGAHGQVGPALGIDAISDGNTAKSLAGIDGCREVNVGDDFTIDLYVTDVVELRGWELYFSFDPSLVEITSSNEALFLGSNIFEDSDPVPDASGKHFFAAGALATTSGSGVLTRITLHAKAAGVSALRIVTDPSAPAWSALRGPILNPGSNPFYDVNGDAVFDGGMSDANVAIGSSCASVPPAPSRTPAPPPPPTPQPPVIPTPTVEAPPPTPPPSAGSTGQSNGQGGGQGEQTTPPPQSGGSTDSPSPTPVGTSVPDGTPNGDPRTAPASFAGTHDPPPADGGNASATGAPRTQDGGSGFPFWLPAAITGAIAIGGGALFGAWKLNKRATD